MSSITDRAEQLGCLSSLEYDGVPAIVHGSLGHAAMMGIDLPPEIKRNGTRRDIDIFATGIGKYTLEDFIKSEGIDTPNPVDAGLSMLIAKDGSSYNLSKDGVSVPFDRVDIFDDTRIIRIPNQKGAKVRTFSPVAMLAVDMLEPISRKPSSSISHMQADLRLKRWFKENGVELPKDIVSSISDFHEEYQRVHPHKQFYEGLADIYVAILPESVRKLFRAHTHKFMSRRTGRPNPYDSK